MTWTTIPDGDIDPDSPITTGLVTALRDNVAASLNQDSGAPVPGSNFITLQAQLSADTVGQAEIKTAYQEVSVSVPASGSATLYFTPTGGTYTLGTTFRATGTRVASTGALSHEILGLTASDVSEYKLHGVGNDGNAFTLYGRTYYINSSPPYDLGFGDIPLFIFILRDATTKDVESVSVSPDAPWHYNGKTNLTPSRYNKNGGAFIKIRQGQAMVEVPLTQEIKNTDMPDIPQPFRGDLAGKEVVVANPQSDICAGLLELHQAGESVAELFHSGDIIIGSANLSRGFDLSVKCFDVSYR